MSSSVNTITACELHGKQHPGKKNLKKGLILANICDKMKIFTQLYWNLLWHLVIVAYWRLLKEGTRGTCNKTQEDGSCILCYPRSQVLKVSDTQCALDRVEIPILILDSSTPALA